MNMDNLGLLKLLHMADSALPIGSTAHSFGIETLVAEGNLEVAQLEGFLLDYLEEFGVLESTFCRLAYRLNSTPEQSNFGIRWLELNNRMSAFKTARESRIASATLGRRLLQLVYSLEQEPILQDALQKAKTTGSEIHYSIAFGLTGSIIGVDETATVLAYLQQSLSCLVSACQRLMPLGQSQAAQIVWGLKPTLLTIASRSEMTILNPDDLFIFTPLLDIGSMRHPGLATRLFIS